MFCHNQISNITYRAGDIIAFILLALYSSSRSDIFGFLTASKGSTFSEDEISLRRAKGAVYEALLLATGSSSSLNQTEIETPKYS